MEKLQDGLGDTVEERKAANKFTVDDNMTRSSGKKKQVGNTRYRKGET